MYLQCVLGQFGPVAKVKVIVRWPGLLGSISGSPAKVNYVHMSNIDHTSKNPGRTINQLLTYVETGISRLSADIDITRTWHPMLGTPVDPRTDTGRYFNDVSRMMGKEGDRWRHRKISLSDHLPDATWESRPSHDDHGCPVFNLSKMAKKHTASTSYT